jgi:hypothetical protein
VKTWQWGALAFVLAVLAIDLAVIAACILFPELWLA